MSVAVEELLSYFDENRFVGALRSRTKAGALKELAAALAEDQDIRHPEVLLEALQAREKLGSTGIGKEVAIPHGRTLSVARLKVLVARAKRGLDWGSGDKKPVKLFFVVVAPPQEKTNHYLPLLGALVGAMQLKANREGILNAKNFDEVYSALETALGG